jgi:hypothetical protein
MNRATNVWYVLNTAAPFHLAFSGVYSGDTQWWMVSAC